MAHKMVGQSVKDGDTTFIIVDTFQGEHDLVYVLKDENGDRWGVQDHDLGTTHEGQHVVCGELLKL